MPRTAFCIALALFLAACGANEQKDRAPTESDAGNLYPIREDGRWGYIDRSGNLAIEPRFDRAWPFSGGVALVKEGGQFGYIRPDGGYAIEVRFDDAWHFTDGIAPVELDGKWGFVDTSGTVLPDTQIALSAESLVEATYDDDPFELVHAGGQYGYEGGERSIAPRFEKAWRFSKGLARVKTNGKWGFINREGEFAIEPRFDLAWDFNRGLAMVQAGDTVGYINRDGQYVWPQDG